MCWTVVVGGVVVAVVDVDVVVVASCDAWSFFRLQKNFFPAVKISFLAFLFCFEFEREDEKTENEQKKILMELLTTSS